MTAPGAGKTQDYSSFLPRVLSCLIVASAIGLKGGEGRMTAAQCDQAFSSSGCTAADNVLYGDFGTCLGNLPACNSSNTQPFLDAVIARTDKLNGLSSGCQ